MSTPVARLKNVSKIYGIGKLQVKALDQLDLEVNKGDYLEGRLLSFL